MTADGPAPTLEEIRGWNWLPDRMDSTAYEQSELAARCVPTLLAALDTAQAALDRHMHTCTAKNGTEVCAGCLYDHPCPDTGVIARALNGGNDGG